MSKIICIQGNIGSGKSTLLRRLEDIGFFCLQEPVDTWAEYQQNGKSILQYFYEDKAKYAFPFQMMAFYTRMKAITEGMMSLKFKNTFLKEYTPLLIMERSLETDKRIFFQLLVNDNSIDPICAKIYNDWYNDIVKGSLKADIINIYIKTPPEVCLERIAKRARPGESEISLQYLTECHKLHEEWLKNDITIDGEKSNEDILTCLKDILKPFCAVTSYNT